MDDDSYTSQEPEIEVLREAEEIESSEDPPAEDWSSLNIAIELPNPKRVLYEEGKFHPGSGEICTKYITQSASSVFRHVYYDYPALTDPGIIDALLRPEPPVIYPDDGQLLYKTLCDEINQCVVNKFYRGLLKSEIDLKYYCVDPRGVLPMAMALKYNKFVKIFDLTDNFLSLDASYHLGDMLSVNNTLVELNLSGCRIGAQGAQTLFTNMLKNKTLVTLNLSYNDLTDTGMEYLAKAVFNGLNIKKIDLSNNSITGGGLKYVTEALETHNKFTHWNLSWNNLYTPGTYDFLTILAETSKTLQEVNLSWNALASVRVAVGIRNILRIKTLKHLNISNNRFELEHIKTIIDNLNKARGLEILNLSCNPFPPAAATLVLDKLKLRATTVKFLYMDNIAVDTKFMQLLQTVRKLKPRVTITHGNLIGGYKIDKPNIRELILNRLDFLCKRQKKKQVDIALLVYRLQKLNFVNVEAKFLIDACKAAGAIVDEDLINEILVAFPGPCVQKVKTINLNIMADYMKRKWPERQLPPTPPPTEIPPPPPPPPPKGKKK